MAKKRHPDGLELYIDLDGVIYDFDGQAEVIGFPRDRLISDRSAFWKAVYKASNYGGGFWNKMSLLSDAEELWEFAAPYNPTFCTATGHTGNAISEKAQAIQRDFGIVATIMVRKSSEKARYAAPNRVLIDDREKSIGPWIEAGGIGILHTSASSTIAQLKALGFV